MSAPFVLAVPSKGRLQENAEAFFSRAGLGLAKPRGAREYRGTIMGLDNVEIAYLSAGEIASQLAIELSLRPRSSGGFILWNVGPLLENKKGVALVVAKQR